MKQNLWFFSSILFFHFHVAFLVSGSCRSDQQSLLLQFRSSLTSDPSKSTRLLQWNSTADCCDWAGVSCDKTGLGRVIGLNLSNETISGGIESSDALFRLQYLQNLDLSYNRFNTAIPARFSNLTGLINLNLSNAGFVGQLPFAVSTMKNLVTLDLTSNPFYTGGGLLKLENPNLATLVQNLTQLRELYLDGVNISAQGNEWGQALWSSLPNLQVLSLSNCLLSGPIDVSLANLSFLSVIRLDGNNLSAPVPDFLANFTNLTVLRLSSCELKGVFPQSIFWISSLEILELAFNSDLQGYLPDSFWNSSLRSLVISNTNFSGRLPESIGALRNLSKLDLAHCNFSGPIPSSMENLTELVYLDLSTNIFAGPIPSFGSSKKLVYMDLSYNNLSGPIPSFGSLSNLVYLDLRYNSLGGSIPSSLFEIPSLRKILLSFNQFVGQILNFSDASSSSLDTLDLSNNKLEGPIPHSIFELRELSSLSLECNNFNGTIKLDQIQQLVNLTTVDLSNNLLTVDANGTNSSSSFSPRLTSLKLASCNLGMFPDLRNQSKLLFLDLSDNRISGPVPEWIGEVGNVSLLTLNLSRNLLVSLPEPLSLPNTLAILDLHDNQLQGNIPTPPRRVTFVDYSDNKFSSYIPNDIGDYISFAIFFSLSNNRVRGRIPQSLCNGTNLQVLDLSHNSLDGSIPSCLIERSKDLRVLNLRKNKFNGRIPDYFPEKCELKTLDLSGNLLEGKVPRSLTNCTMLEILDLGSNKINDVFPCLLRNLSSLRALILRNNQFSGDLIHCPSISPSINPTWTKLQIVDIASNNFSGRLPNSVLRSWKAMMGDGNETHDRIKFDFLRVSQLYYQDSITVTSKGREMQFIKILTIFTSIDVSCNKFEGLIPDGLGKLNALYVLNLSHNALTGDIPRSLGDGLQLESLDLSSNNLTGEIPQQLAGLNFLSFLNLSNNKLFGIIPTSTQLQSFSEDSFEGNNGLCGPPLQTKCSDTPPARKTEFQRNTENEFDWRFIVPGLGFGAGAALAVAPLLFWKKANECCDDRIDKILMVLLPMLGFVYYPKGDWRIEPDETFELVEDTSSYDDDDEESEDDDIRGRYCVFCTKLDITRKRAIHDLKCICHHSPPFSSSSSSSLSSSASS
ncbi:receptor-like protein 7 [Mercurialis annua]|uniref:receptor-like protein 7 n=1 Tax=Mercurialis annua TaxID=3986 RepID=UPI00215E0475|nr:receptor-like protein 7 [Mercurialis annua]